jgi:hypothetical protein
MNSSARSFRLLLVGAAALGAVALWDLIAGSQILDLPSRGALLAAGLVLVVAVWRSGHVSRWRRPAVAALLCVLAGLAVSLIGDYQVRAVHAEWEERSHAQLLLEADQVGAEFRLAMERLAAPSELVAANPQSPVHAEQPDATQDLFDEVARLRRETGTDTPRFGLTLVDGSGEPVAWSGGVSVPDRGLYTALYFEPTAVLVSDTAVATRLFHPRQPPWKRSSPPCMESASAGT